MIRITGKAVFLIFLSFSLFLVSINIVNAAGPFDQTCTNCQGTGTVTHSVTITCPSCQGTGEITTTNTCDKCGGTGKITVTTTCNNCGGSGTVAPSVRVVSSNGFGTLNWLDWIARCEITLQNEEDQGTYCVVESKVNTVSEAYYHQSSRTYLAPHTNVKVTIDTPEIGALTDWTYSIYIKSTDSITCNVCKGSGGISTISTCDKCSGQGTVTTTVTCANCQGMREITKQESQTCPTCNGTRYVTNWMMISIVAVLVIALVAGSTGALMLRRKSKHQ